MIFKILQICDGCLPGRPTPLINTLVATPLQRRPGKNIARLGKQSPYRTVCPACPGAVNIKLSGSIGFSGLEFVPLLATVNKFGTYFYTIITLKGAFLLFTAKCVKL
jgi:hypothetical protein